MCARPPGLVYRTKKLRAATSNAFVDQPCEKAGVDHELAPLGVEIGGRLGCDGLVARLALLLQLRNIVPDGNQHVTVRLQLRLVADGLAMPGNDDGIVVDHCETGFCRLDLAVDAAACGIVGEGIDSVPIDIAGV